MVTNHQGEPDHAADTGLAIDMGLATAYWTTGSNDGTLRSEHLAAPGPGEVAVTALHSAISRGTERLVRSGAVPPSVAHQMRAPFQVGDFGDDVKYGYLSVGVITGIGPALPRSSPAPPARVAQDASPELGQRVFCHHPHQDRYVVPEAAVTALPDDVPSARATLAGTVETAINIVWDARPHWGDRVAVVGGGLVGACVAIMLGRMRLHRLLLLDPDPATKPLADQAGATWVHPRECTAQVDLVIHCSGTQQGLHQGLSMLDAEGELIEASWYGQHSPTVPLGEAFHAKRLTIRASQVSQVAASNRARRSHADRMALALAELRDPLYDALITGHTPFADLPTAMSQLDQLGGGRWCHVVDYRHLEHPLADDPHDVSDPAAQEA